MSKSFRFDTDRLKDQHSRDNLERVLNNNPSTKSSSQQYMIELTGIPNLCRFNVRLFAIASEIVIEHGFNKNKIPDSYFLFNILHSAEVDDRVIALFSTKYITSLSKNDKEYLKHKYRSNLLNYIVYIIENLSMVTVDVNDNDEDNEHPPMTVKDDEEEEIEEDLLI